MHNNGIKLLYFSGINCNVCKAMFPKIKEMTDEKFNKIKLLKYYIEDDKNIFINYQVMSIPTVILIVDGKEFIKKVRNFSIVELEKEIDRIYKLYYK